MQCPDCAAEPADIGVIHEDSCPLWAALMEQKTKDRQYFKEHTNRTMFRRKMIDAEIMQMVLAGALPPPPDNARWKVEGPMKIELMGELEGEISGTVLRQSYSELKPMLVER